MLRFKIYDDGGPSSSFNHGIVSNRPRLPGQASSAVGKYAITPALICPSFASASSKQLRFVNMNVSHLQGYKAANGDGRCANSAQLDFSVNY
jgi:hypothetical protein